MKRELIFGIFFTILALSLISLASAYTCPAGSHTYEGGTLAEGPEWCIPDVGAGVCTGTQTCFCSGKAVDCPCNADPCVICGPTSQECRQYGNPQTQTANRGTVESNNVNPQTPSDFLGLIGNGISTLVLTAFGQPSTVEGKAQASPPTITEIILSIIALTAIIAAVVAILKAMLTKILISRTGASALMSKPQPSRRNPTLSTGETSWSPRYNPASRYRPKRGPNYEKV